MCWNSNSGSPNWVEATLHFFCILMLVFHCPKFSKWVQEIKALELSRLEFKLEQGFFSSWVVWNKSVHLSGPQFDLINYDSDEVSDVNTFKKVYQFLVTL